MIKLTLPIFILFSAICASSFAQVSRDSSLDVQKDISDLFSRIPKVEDEKVEMMKLYLPVLPLVGYMPANGFIIGAAALPSICLDSVEHTRMSSMMANVQITSKKQVNFNVRSNVYLSHDNWILQGDWRFLFYSQPTYGLGVFDAPGDEYQTSLNIGADGTNPCDLTT